VSQPKDESDFCAHVAVFCKKRSIVCKNNFKLHKKKPQSLEKINRKKQKHYQDSKNHTRNSEKSSINLNLVSCNLIFHYAETSKTSLLLRIASELSTESSKRELAEKEAQKLKRDVEELKRAEKVKKPGSKQNDIRLQRALDEVQKYKSEMAELVRKNRDQGTVTRHQFDEASKETQKQKRLNSEYKSVIQKQSKLIEILRNKCTHLEAARVLEFTEEEFLRALDWQK